MIVDTINNAVMRRDRVDSVEHICDYVEGHLFGELCDIMMCNV